MIDLSSFRKALGTLDEALRARERAPEDEFIRDACLQRFKYCYELSHTALRRCLRESGSAEANEMSFQTLVRLEVDQGLLARGWDWSEYRVARKSASEDGDQASAAVAILPQFLNASNFYERRLRASRREAIQFDWPPTYPRPSRLRCRCTNFERHLDRSREQYPLNLPGVERLLCKRIYRATEEYEQCRVTLMMMEFLVSRDMNSLGWNAILSPFLSM